MMRKEVRIREDTVAKCESLGFFFSLKKKRDGIKRMVTLKHIVMAADRFQVPSQHCAFIV